MTEHSATFTYRERAFEIVVSAAGDGVFVIHTIAEGGHSWEGTSDLHESSHSKAFALAIGEIVWTVDEDV